MKAYYQKQAAGLSLEACFKIFQDIVFVIHHFSVQCAMFVLLYLCKHTTLILLKEYKVRVFRLALSGASWFLTDWIHSCTKSHKISTTHTHTHTNTHCLKLIKELGPSFP